jgi:signal transduction histidine kinase
MIKNNVGTSGHQDVLVSPSSLPATPRKHTAAMAGEGDSSKELIFTVQDTGAGIPHKYLDQIFEKFKQADQSQTDKPKGTGLGLPICKEIVEHHGGRIWVNSLPGRGSTFAFSLPVD